MRAEEIEKLHRAIDTLNCFTMSYDERKAPPCEESLLRKKTLSRLLEPLLKGRKKRAPLPKKIELLDSLNTIHVALIKLRSGHPFESALYEKLAFAIQRYNHVVYALKKKPKTISEKIRSFFSKNEEIAEILLVHKFSFIPPDARSHKICSLIKERVMPHQEEVDLFHAKAHTRLKEALPPPIFEEAIKRLRQAPIEATLKAESIISLKKTIPTPEGELVISYDIQRKNHFKIPIKDSFFIRRECASPDERQDKS